MSLELTGKILEIYEAQQVSEKFRKREFVLELAEEINGNIYTNFAKLQLVQAKCDIINNYKRGDVVRVSFNVKGNSYVDKKDGLTKYITNLDAWRIEYAANAATQSPAPAQPQQAYSNPNVNAGNNYAPAPNYNQAPNYNPAPTYNTSTEAVDDLPF